MSDATKSRKRKKGPYGKKTLDFEVNDIQKHGLDTDIMVCILLF